MKNRLPLLSVLFFIGLQSCLYAQTPQGCNTAAIRSAFAAAGHYTELVVSGQPCSLYFIDNNSSDATTAEANAQALGANMAVMNDAAENANVVAALNAGGYLSSGQIIWLGYHRTGAGDGVPFQTLDGSPFNYSNWNAGEPNNSGYGGGLNGPSCYNSVTHCTFCSDQYLCTNGEQCVQIYASGTWNDLSCNSNSTAVIEVNLCPQITTNNDTLLCTNTATLNFTSSTILGSPPYTYSWSPGGQNTSGITVNPTTTTTYDITATDRYSCYSSEAIVVTVVNMGAPVVTATPSSLCVNQTTIINYTGSYSGTAVLNWGFSGGTVTGSSAPYTESWPNAGPQNVTLYVTDQGCTSPTGTAAITVNGYPVANAGADVAICSGAATTLGVASVVGVSYSWSPAIGLSSTVVSNPTFTTVNPGTITLSYLFILTATSNNCAVSDTAIVTLYPPINNSFTVSPTAVCTGQNAVITYTGTNSAAATYTWNFAGGNVVSGNGQGPYTVNWAAAGNPAVTLSVNENNCSSAASTVNVTVNALPVADAGPYVQFCSGATANLGAAPVSGVSYSWSPAVGLSNAAIANPTITAVNPGSTNIVQNYTVTASANGCTASDVTVVTLYQPIVTSFTANPNTVCINGNAIITYTGTNSAAATYTWNFAGANVVSGTGQGPYTVNWSTASNPSITLNVTENGCTGIASSQAVAVGNPPVADAGPNQTVCSGGSIQLGTTAVAGVNYTWSPSTNLDNGAIAQPSFSYSNTTGTQRQFIYTVTADNNGCTATAQATITVSPPAPVAIVASGPLEFCDGGTVTLSLALPYSIYQWSNNSNSPTITITTPGAFSVAVADASGCQFVAAPVSVIIDPTPTVSLVQQTNESCYGFADGSLTVTGATGTPGFSYAWSTLPAQTTNAAINLAPGVYSVTVTDSKSCTVTGQYSIDSAQYFVMAIDSVHQVSCYGFSDGAIYPSVRGGTPAYTYAWSDGKNNLLNENLAVGTYDITITDAHGCPAIDSAVISQPAQVILTAPDSLEMDFASHVTLQLNVSPAGSYTYQWSPANSLSCSSCQNPVSFAPENTTYNVVVTDNNGCVNNITFTLVVNAGKHLFIPNVFTPGNNGSNNFFEVYTYGDNYFSMKVFDRWGEKMFESNDRQQGWDGTYNGKYVQAGVYVYEMTVTYLDGQTVHRNGAVTVLR